MFFLSTSLQSFRFFRRLMAISSIFLICTEYKTNVRNTGKSKTEVEIIVSKPSVTSADYIINTSDHCLHAAVLTVL